ncbi:DMP19 family protein [Rubellicoccus peritrichatus]|uniref:DUF4375 domain-containing protein n=1 Tax=Rubellicoccus peritrichatus TaxID=3080537 RepID=A0AAQ3LB49_9BACT|nr:DUF4375 domain-containing protein [Puniceicoccus sp. CR14]WOO42590.1 DUF4375 domain-containing protein [Puniceicoccus sp. CR14]
MKIRGFLYIALTVVLLGCSSEDSSREKDNGSEIELTEKEQYFVDQYGYEPAYVAELYRMPDAEVRQVVEAFVKSQGQSESYWKLIVIQERAIPYLIAVLKDEKNYIRPSRDSHAYPNESPAERALSRLKRGHYPEIKPYLLSQVSNDDYNVRFKIASHTAAFGTDDVLESVVELANDEKEHVRSGVSIGIREAVKSGKAADNYKEKLWEVFKEIYLSGGTAMYRDPLNTLLVIDEEKAVALLNTPENLDTDNPNLERVLSVLLQTETELPADYWLSLLEVHKPGIKSSKSSRIFEKCLIALARKKHPKGRELLEKVLEEKPNDEERKLEGYQRARIDRQLIALNALMQWDGKESDYDKAFELAGEVDYDWDQVDPKYWKYLFPHYLDAEVRNGGFSQYFFNSSSDYNEECLEALKLIGATEHHRILSKATKQFGFWGPSKDRGKRQSQLENLSDEEAEALYECNDEWYDLDYPVGYYLLKYDYESGL